MSPTPILCGTISCRSRRAIALQPALQLVGKTQEGDDTSKAISSRGGVCCFPVGSFVLVWVYQVAIIEKANWYLKMSARASMLRIIPRRGTSSSSPQHTSSPFRLSPSISNNNQSSFIINSTTSSSSSTRTLSRRTITSTIRTQTNQSTLRAALSNEISSLRYTLLLESEGEESLLRGWDAGVVDDDEDGTWVFSCELIYYCW